MAHILNTFSDSVTLGSTDILRPTETGIAPVACNFRQYCITASVHSFVTKFRYLRNNGTFLGNCVSNSKVSTYLFATSVGWQVTLCDPIWHVIAIAVWQLCELLYTCYLLTYLLTVCCLRRYWWHIYTYIKVVLTVWGRQRLTVEMAAQTPTESVSSSSADAAADAAAAGEASTFTGRHLTNSVDKHSR